MRPATLSSSRTRWKKDTRLRRATPPRLRRATASRTLPSQQGHTSYDALNRLTEMQRGTLNSGKTGITGTPTREMDYTLDPTGNWPTYVTKTSGTTDLNQSRTSNKVNEITAVSGTPTWATPAYDAAGNMTTIPQVATPTSSFTAVYDAWNRMVSLTAGSGTTYKYDGANRRIVKVTTSPSETRHYYFTNQWQDIEEQTGSTPTMQRQYVWGIRYVDELVCRDDSTPTRYYAMQDANFNLTSICDTSAAVQERYRYDPYGNVTYMNTSWTVISASAKAWQINHQGLLQDVESGLIYNRNRMVQPMLGRFGSRDPIHYYDSISLYEVELSNSLTSLDPFGTKSGQVYGPPAPGQPFAPTSQSSSTQPCPCNKLGPPQTIIKWNYQNRPHWLPVSKKFYGTDIYGQQCTYSVDPCGNETLVGCGPWQNITEKGGGGDVG